MSTVHPYRARVSALTLRRVLRPAVWLGVVLALSACALPEKPTAPSVFDLGMIQAPSPNAPGSSLAVAVALNDIEAPLALDGTGVLYRLAYAQAQQLRPYANARWSMAPAQLVQQRLRERLAQGAAVLNRTQAASLRNSGVLSVELTVQLEEFCQVFTSAQNSQGQIRLRATLMQGNRLLGQKVFTAQQAASAADAPGGVQALASATDVAVGELQAWVTQLSVVAKP